MKNKSNKKSDKVKNPAWGYFLFAITFIAVGVCFIIFTTQSKDLMCYFIGGVTILAAVINIVMILAKKSRGAAFFVKMLLCVLAVICGIVVMISKNSSLEYIVAITSLMLIIDCSFKLQTAVKVREYRAGLWWALVILVIVGYAVNMYLIKFYDPEKSNIMLVILGCDLILDGAMNLVTPIFLSSVNRKIKLQGQKENPPEAQGGEVEENVTSESRENKL